MGSAEHQLIPPICASTTSLSLPLKVQRERGERCAWPRGSEQGFSCWRCKTMRLRRSLELKVPGSCESIWEKCFNRLCEARSIHGTDSEWILCIRAPGLWQGGSWKLYHGAVVRPARSGASGLKGWCWRRVAPPGTRAG